MATAIFSTRCRSFHRLSSKRKSPKNFNAFGNIVRVISKTNRARSSYTSDNRYSFDASNTKPNICGKKGRAGNTEQLKCTQGGKEKLKGLSPLPVASTKERRKTQFIMGHDSPLCGELTRSDGGNWTCPHNVRDMGTCFPTWET